MVTRSSWLFFMPQVESFRKIAKFGYRGIRTLYFKYKISNLFHTPENYHKGRDCDHITRTIAVSQEELNALKKGDEDDIWATYVIKLQYHSWDNKLHSHNYTVEKCKMGNGIYVMQMTLDLELMVTPADGDKADDNQKLTIVDDGAVE